MSENLHNIDDLFRNSIDNHTEELPGDVWNNIDHNLDKKQAAFYKRKYFATRAAVIALLLCCGIAVALIIHFNHSKNLLVSKTGRKQQNSSVIPTKKTSLSGQDKEKNIGFKENDQRNKEKLNPQDKKQKNEVVSNAEKTYNNLPSKQAAGDLFEIAIKNNTDKQKGKKKSSDKSINEEQLLNITVQDGNIKKKTETNTANEERPVITGNSMVQVDKVHAMTSFSLTEPGKTVTGAPAITFSPAIKKSNGRSFAGSWNIAPVYSQNVNMNTLKDDDHFRDPRNNRREAKESEQEAQSFTLGVGIEKQLGRKIFIQSGLQYFSSRTTIEPKTIFAKQDDNGEIRYQFRCSSGDSYISNKTGVAPAIGDSIKTDFSTSNLAYLQVPLLASYKINAGKFSVSPSVGMYASFLLKGKLNSSLPQPAGVEKISTSIDGLRKMYLSAVLQSQFDYVISDRVSITVVPGINFSLSPINKGTAIRTYQNMIGLGAGIRIKL